MIDDFILPRNLRKVSACLDDFTVTGSTLEEHDQNLQKLLAAAEHDAVAFNEKTLKIRQEKIQLLGHEISQASIKSRVHPNKAIYQNLAKIISTLLLYSSTFLTYKF